MANLKKNRRLILERLEKEAQGGMDYIDAKISERFRGIMGRVLRRLAREIFSWAERRGALHQVVKIFDLVLDVAEKHPEERVNDLAEKYLEKYLAKHVLYHRIDKNHPEVEELKNAFKKEFEARLRIYRPILFSEGETYEELVRNAYPQRKTLEKFIDEQFKTTRKTLEIIDQNPEMFKVPGALKKSLLKLGFASMEFMHEKIIEDLENIYGG